MFASLTDFDSCLDVESWKKGKGFCLNLLYENSYDLDRLRRDSLVPSLSRNSKDDLLEQYFYLFLPLEHYIKIADV